MTVAGAPIVQYWHDEDIPAQITPLLATFDEHNPDMPHLVFNERSATEFIAERYGARHAEAFQVCGVPAMQADYLRYCAVHSLGGIYADANFVTERALQPLLETEGYLFAQPPLGPVLNGFFAFRSPGHPLLEMAIEAATRNIETRISESVALTTGPVIFSGLIQLLRGGSPEDLREVAGQRIRPFLDSCWEALIDSLRDVINDRGRSEDVLEGVRISTRAEMQTWVWKPPIRHKGHWAHWKGTIFRPAESRTWP